jgi:hypothetical protein
MLWHCDDCVVVGQRSCEVVLLKEVESRATQRFIALSRTPKPWTEEADTSRLKLQHEAIWATFCAVIQFDTDSEILGLAGKI